MREIKFNSGDIIRINPMVFLNSDHPIFISDELCINFIKLMMKRSVDVVIFYDDNLGELAFEAFNFVFPISFVLDQKDRYPLHIIGNAIKNPELLEVN